MLIIALIPEQTVSETLPFPPMVIKTAFFFDLS